MKILPFITALRESDTYLVDIYTMGSCYQFHRLLKKMYPAAQPYISKNKDHIITFLNGYFYDITGIVSAKGFTLMGFTDHLKARRWSFRNNCLIQLTECEYCEEPIIFDRHKFEN